MAPAYIIGFQLVQVDCCWQWLLLYGVNLLINLLINIIALKKLLN